MSLGLTHQQRTAILADYQRKTPAGAYRYTIERVAGRHQVTAGVVNQLRVQAGLQRNGVDRGPSLYGCPACGFRALHPLGHAACLGDEAMAAIEASQALLVVSQTVVLEQEVA